MAEPVNHGTADPEHGMHLLTRLSYFLLYLFVVASAFFFLPLFVSLFFLSPLQALAVLSALLVEAQGFLFPAQS